MLLLLFIAAFATDLGAWYRQGQAQQRAADVGSLNGIQAYNRGVQDYFESLPPRNGLTVTWLNATNAEKVAAERAGMTEAVNTVVGLLETSGLTFNNNPTPTIISEPTADELPGGESVYELIADDGTVVVIRRVTVTDPIDGTTSNAISVSLTAEGQQYFSNVLRDAPEITRAATSTLSNCGGICQSDFEIFPPFAGFAASGSGDGFGPLLFNKDGVDFNGFEEIWAINHHIDHVDGRNSRGSIICMDAETQQSCLGGGAQFDLRTIYPNLQTANRPVEYIDENRGIILFAARDAGLLQSGLACWNAATRSLCDTPFLPLFDATVGPDSGNNFANWINANGPFKFGNNFYVFAQDGTWGCATLSNTGSTLTNCGGGDTPAVAAGGLPDINDNRWFIGHGEQFGNGSRLIMRQPRTNNEIVWYCFDLSSQAPCWGGSGYTVTTTAQVEYQRDQILTFQRYTGAGENATPTAVCTVRLANTALIKHVCIDPNNGAASTVPGLNAFIGGVFDADGGHNASWGGDTFTYQGQGVTRTLFAGGNSNYVFCWDWATGACGAQPIDFDITGVQTNFRANHEVRPYAFAQVSRGCVIGLSHESVFFTINPVTLQKCVDSQVETLIEPCQCEDGTPRWGIIQLPDELLLLVDRAEATLTDPATGTVYVQGNQPEGDVLANGGSLDLSHVPNSVSQLSLVLVVDAKLDPNGDPVWTNPLPVEIELVVQPTLAN